MKINKFNSTAFGALTTITNPDTGITMFIGKEIANIWGHTNLTQSIKAAKLNASEYKVIKLNSYPCFKKELSNSGLVTSQTPTITLLAESGMYKLALASNLEKAKPFKDWVASEVLPSIRKNGYYSFANSTEKMMLNTNIAIQKDNSKNINKKHFIEKGVEAVIEYNRQSCLLHTGKRPKDIVKEGKELGLKSKDISSAKQVLRATKPAIACAMSFTDSLVQQGFDLKTVSELSMKAALPLFQGMLELGVKPAELND